MADRVILSKARSLNIQLFFGSSFEHVLQKKMLAKAVKEAARYCANNTYRLGSMVLIKSKQAL